MRDSGRNGNTWPHNRQIAAHGRAKGDGIGYDFRMQATPPKAVGQDNTVSAGLWENPDTHWGEVVAVYAHFPFCRHLCTYCDFDKFAGIERLIGPYSDAMVEQVRRSPQARAVSLYVGGGTPSLMEPGHAVALVAACRDRFGQAESAETTIEANPTGLDQDRLHGFREAGFNRLSLGIQSADPRLLRLLGRRHRHEDSLAAVEQARKAGFSNISVDLIYGLPYQTLESWRATLEATVEMGVEHLSCYMLTVEQGTPLERGVSRGTIPTPDDDLAAAMYEDATSFLRGMGYQRYEISNWALAGRESAHNRVYWRNQPYLAIGAGAAGYWLGRRYKIRPDVAGFIERASRGRLALAENEQVDEARAMSESLILGLRLAEGVAREAFRSRHGRWPEELFGDSLSWADELGLLDRSGDRLTLTEKGILLSNELFERLL